MPARENPLLPDCNDFKSVARALTVVENDLPGADELLRSLDSGSPVPVTGITGPPGAGKSTLLNRLIGEFVNKNGKIAVLAIDPTSPFNGGSLLGDRIRMNSHFNHPDVFIRSLATRGSLGGLSAKTIEMTDVLRAAGFDHVFIETVGVGQSEIEIAGLADTTLVVLVPEGGDEIQHIKSGLMEIADAVIVNKADRDGADLFTNTLKKIIQHGANDEIPVFKAVATVGIGISEVAGFILAGQGQKNSRKELMLAEKAYKIIQQKRMADIDKKKLKQDISNALNEPGFNLYSFAEKYR